MSENNNGQTPNNTPQGNKPNKQKKGKNWMYAVYILLIAVFGMLWLGGDNEKGLSRNIGWNQLEQILLKGDQEKIVVVNQEWAEVHIKSEAIKNDTAYDNLTIKNAFGKSTVAEKGFYRYEFVTFENFEKDLARVENQIIARDTVGVEDPAEVQRIINTTRVDMTPERRANVLKDLMLWFGPLFILIIFFVLMNRMTSKQMGGGGGGGIFNMGKTNAKMYDGKVPTNVTFKDVAGMTGAKEEVVEVVDFLKNPKKYTDLGGKIPKGVILVGPPGTGKTLLAKAVAGEAKVPFFSTSGSDFVEMFVGMGASRVRSLFEEAKKKSPCIIFIDEIDAVGRARGRSGLSNANDERENTLNALLTEMDGFGSGTNVIVMAATNRVDVLDKALLRAGRFDRQIQVDLPDLDERQAIFEVHMRGLKVSEEIDREFLAKQTPGFSGADIANVCNEAALAAARNSHKAIEKQDFLDAIDRIIGGIEKKTKVFTATEKRTIAYHECGHASVSWLTQWGDPLVKVTIVPRGMALGAAWYLPDERQLNTYEQLLDQLCSLLAGRASEEVFIGRVSTGAQNDLERATKIAFGLVAYYGMSPEVGNLSYYDSTGQSDFNFTKPFSEKTSETIDREVRRILDEQYLRAKNIILEHKDKIQELADKLYDREVIFSSDVEDTFGARPWPVEPKISSKLLEKSTTEEAEAPKALAENTSEEQRLNEETTSISAPLDATHDENTETQGSEEA